MGATTSGATSQPIFVVEQKYETRSSDGAVKSGVVVGCGPTEDAAMEALVERVLEIDGYQNAVGNFSLMGGSQLRQPSWLDWVTKYREKRGAGECGDSNEAVNPE